MIPKISKILYATDLGPGAPYVFRYALSLARQYDARISILNAMEPLSSFGQSLVELHISHQQSEDIHRQAREHVKKDIVARVEKLCEKELTSDPEGRKRVADILVLEAPPALAIIDEAKRLGADLIVMGTHRHTVLGEALLGTTAHKVLHMAEIPVMLVRIPDGYKEEGL